MAFLFMLFYECGLAVMLSSRIPGGDFKGAMTF